VDQDEPFRWSGIDELAYKEDGSIFKSVTRRVLFDEETGQGVQVRYFEVGLGGHTTLEKHQHTHNVIPIRGVGACLIGDEVFDLAVNDLVHVPTWAWHQFRNMGDEPFGFVCVVTVDRDRPTLPAEDDLAALRSIPTVAEFIRR
jgi:mannose-6-phosphate isomerase-like protein (cupin superfamily)